MSSSVDSKVEDRVNNNGVHGGGGAGGTTLHHHKDEYMEDPLPDLIGSLRIADEPEPDLTSTDFVLEDFEFSVNTSSEEEEGSESSGSGSDLEFFDISSMGSSLFLDDPSTTTTAEAESVELDLGTGSGDEGKGGGVDGQGQPPQSRTKLSEAAAQAKRIAATVKELVGKRKKLRNIRVVYHNFDKPYTARVSSSHYKKFLTLGPGGAQGPHEFGGMSQSSSFNDSPIELGMTAEELEAARLDWQAELNQVDEEIQTLKQVLASKTRRAHELKRKLGVTAWGSFTTDMGQGIKNVRESNAVHKIEETFTEIGSAVTSAPIYQKTESAIKATAEKTTSLLGGIGSAMSQKIGALKNTDSFRSMEERVSSAVSSVKTKVGGSRSGSVQNFDEALREATGGQGDVGGGSKPNGTPTPPVTSPTTDDKPLS